MLGNVIVRSFRATLVMYSLLYLVNEKPVDRRTFINPFNNRPWMLEKGAALATTNANKSSGNKALKGIIAGMFK